MLSTFLLLIFDHFEGIHHHSSRLENPVQSLKAMEFAEGGLVLLLRAARNVNIFDCQKFSCFPEERETLFFGGDTELRIKSITQWAQGRWRKYGKFMEPIHALSRMITAKTLWDQPIWNNKKAQKWMKVVLRDYIDSQLTVTGNLEIPDYVHSLVSYQLSSTEHVRLNWNELKSGYQWMSDVIKSDANLLDIAKLSVLFSDSTSITFVVSNGVGLDELEWESVVDGLSAVHAMGLSMTFKFELSSESRQDDMYRMAKGFLIHNESKWECQRHGNVLVFSLDDQSAVDGGQTLFRQRASTIRDYLGNIEDLQLMESGVVTKM